MTAGGVLIDGAELELDQHHVVAQPHREVERGSSGQKVIHLKQK